jgi:thiamine pyrophosphate-dependent acetolactate synthase large subunit-like protein
MWCHAQVPWRMIGTDAFQETPIVEVTRQITKHNYLVMDIRDLPRVVKEVQSQLVHHEVSAVSRPSHSL